MLQFNSNALTGSGAGVGCGGELETCFRPGAKAPVTGIIQLVVRHHSDKSSLFQEGIGEMNTGERKDSLS